MEYSPSTRRLTIGMVAWHALPAICPRAGTSVGGLETGVWTLARGLRRYTDADVAIAVSAGRGSIPEQVDGVRLWLHRHRLAEIRRSVSECVSVGPPLRIKRLRPALLWQLPLLLAARPWRPPQPQPMRPDPRLAHHEVDVWAGFGVNGDSARVAATALAQQRPMLLFLESNADLDPRLARGEEFVNAYGETSAEQRFALQQATQVVCQSQWQQQRLKELFQRDGVLIRNPIDIREWRPDTGDRRSGVLWIGRYDNFHKRPHLALEIARHCPEIKFRMITNRHDPEIEASVRQQLPPNVELVDYVPFDRMPYQFASAKAFLSTGSPEHEGFPNVLLQAAAAKTPIVSLHDFDDFLSQSGAGFSCEGSVEQAATRLRATVTSDSVASDSVASDPIDWEAVERYLIRCHSLEQLASDTFSLARQLASRGNRHGGGTLDRGTRQ